MNDLSSGFLSIMIGPMWSGKTSKLVDKYKQCKLCGIPILPINYSLDTRYGDEVISTHDERKIPCIMAKYLSDISNICDGEITQAFKDAHVILINEAQFFEDIKVWVICAVEEHHKRVYICGLDGDHRRSKFGDVLDLIPFCDEVIKLHSICMACKKCPAIFTKRAVDNEKNMLLVGDISQEQIVIGTDIYKPLCRKCYTD
uniref:thymidine kinase n=1 Tax=viral metagenome TaxID=1070528 RepID=A0A6C0BZ12_9ZZZZ